MSNFSTRLSGKSAVITGASSGLGVAFARELHECGCSLILIARRRERLDMLAAELNAKRPASVKVFAADLSLEQTTGGVPSLQEVVEFLRHQQIDILINNAGRGSFGPSDELSLQEECALIGLNVRAPVCLSATVLAGMKARREGWILNVCSISAFLMTSFMATYSASKSFLFTYSLATRAEAAPFGIKILAYCPGPIATEFAAATKLPQKLPQNFNMSAANAAHLGLVALDSGAPYVIPGALNKILVTIAGLLPSGLRARLSGATLQRYVPRADSSVSA